MKKLKIVLIMLIIIVNLVFITGCWNYREIDELSIVAGMAIDKGVKERFQITIEVIKISGGKDTDISSTLMSTEGKTIFDAVRNMIALSGKRLYWAHTKVVILSKDVASESVSKAIELFNRDAETRESVHLLISQKNTAKEIFNEKVLTENIKSFALDEMIKNQVNLSKAPIIDIMDFDIESKNKWACPIIPAVNTYQMNGKITPMVMGTAIIKNDKLVGFLNSDETKSLIFIRNQVKGGIITESIQQSKTPTIISLEIFNNRTKIKPVVTDNSIKFNININTTVAIDEIMGKINFLDDNERINLERNTESTLKHKLDALINKCKSEYNADIFGFGAKLQEDNAKVWKKYSDNWNESFSNLNVEVNANIHIRNSAVLSKSINEGD